MEWNRSNTIGLSKASCTYCHGHGLRVVRKGVEVPCKCVFRAIFRACFQYFRECAVVGAQPGKVSLEYGHGPQGRCTYSRKREEYMADFCLVSRKVLTDEEHSIFRYHFLLGADWRFCCNRLHMNRGDFFHLVYRIEQVLGCTFANLKPYPLYPLNEYFGAVTQKDLPFELPPPPVRSARRRRFDHLPMIAEPIAA